MRVACCQLTVAFNDPQTNADRVCATVRELSKKGVELAVFPECFLTGYAAASAEEARSIAISETDHPVHTQIQAVVEETGIVAIVGFAGIDSEDKLRNTAGLYEPGMPMRRYRKAHLLCLGYDRFDEAGDELEVFDTKVGRIGILICYDLRPPEAARVLTLKGAEIICLPTNWPIGAEVSAQSGSISRAAENRVFMATADRVGQEKGTTFIGHSRIIAPSGQILAAADHRDEAIVIADCDLAQARQKHVVNIPGEYELDVIACRRPELYGVLGE
ncbi:MAG: carbon-nitrogen hydrolase family protein [Fimbriimonadaceae bacterium]|nr:carbon-nitrogen hydrolase family protein [Fimbriimonadaceae bacterium]